MSPRRVRAVRFAARSGPGQTDSETSILLALPLTAGSMTSRANPCYCVLFATAGALLMSMLLRWLAPPIAHSVAGAVVQLSVSWWVEGTPGNVDASPTRWRRIGSPSPSELNRTELTRTSTATCCSASGSLHLLSAGLLPSSICVDFAGNDCRGRALTANALRQNESPSKSTHCVIGNCSDTQRLCRVGRAIL
jgi:hypothetical protein